MAMSRTSLVTNALLPRMTAVLFILLFLSALSLGPKMLNLDGDLPRHLLMGRYILQNKALPTTELFIYPYLGQPYVPHEWLTDVIFYAIYSTWGFAGLVLFAALLLATTFSLLYKGLSDRLHLSLPIFILVAWGAVATSLNWAIRPHLVSMCLLGFWLLWTDDLQRGKKIPLWIFPVVMFFWSNLHGEFIAGMLVLFAYTVGWTLEYVFDRSRTDPRIGQRLWMAFFLSAIACLLNPSGLEPWLTILGVVNNEYLMSRMSEGNSPNFQKPEMQVLFSLLAGSIVLLAIKKNRLSIGQGFLLAGFSAMSLIAIRNVHLYGIVAPFVLAETLEGVRNISLMDRLEQAFQNIEGKLKGVTWVLVPALVITCAVILGSGMRNTYRLQEPMFPARAVEWLEDHPQTGKMFNDLNWGGYLGLHIWPSQLTFIDSMSDTTGSITSEYETVITMSPGWQEILERYKVNWAILPSELPLARELEVQGWEPVYQDETAVILVRE